MQTARRIVKSIFRDIFITCLILGVFGAVIVGWSMSPTQYIYRKTEFLSYEFPEEVYDFDAIGHGKDYDSLHIFKLKGWDGKRFLHDLENKKTGIRCPWSWVQKSIPCVTWNSMCICAIC